MTDPQWQTLLEILHGRLLDPLPVGFIIDSPWLPHWAGITILDYYCSEHRWLEANRKAVETFPQVLFLPGFWSEYGMCTEPAAFGAKCSFGENAFPFAQPLAADPARLARLNKPNCRTDGLCPFVIKRLAHCRWRIEAAGHKIRFAVSRGPHNIASFLLGHTEMLMAVKTDPEALEKLLEKITDFVVDWLQYQCQTFDSIDGILVLDDLIGFLGEDDFKRLVLQPFARISRSLDVTVKALHNDSHGLITAKYLGRMGFNLFNFAFDHGLARMRELAGEGIVLMGNLPPRDVLASGTADDVRRSVAKMLDSIDDKRRILFSCGGGMPPNVSTENLAAFCRAVADT